MEQHPVPQPITSYEFRLVGDMTLKQFGKLASGVILALIVYGINPAPGILKWSLIGIFVFIGVAMAFFPFQGRPVDTWIIAFFKRIYSPTQYVWRQGGKVEVKPVYEVVKVPEPSLTTTPVKPTEPDKTTAINYQVPTFTINVSKKDAQNESQLPAPQKPPFQEPAVDTANLSNRIWLVENKLTPPPSDVPDNEIMATLFKAPPGQTTDQIAPSTANVDGISIGKTTIFSADTPQPAQSQPAQTPTIAPTYTPGTIIPTMPDTPNILAGFVKDSQGKLVEGAIIEVRDAQSNPVRAFKTNKLGQFQIATPLPNGVFEIETEKENLIFDIIKIELVGTIVPPIEITAKPSI